MKLGLQSSLLSPSLSIHCLSIHETVTASDVFSRFHLKVPCLDVGWQREAHSMKVLSEGTPLSHTLRIFNLKIKSQLQYFILLC